MTFFNNSNTNKLTALAIVLLSLCSLTACGFRPLLAESKHGKSVADGMASIYIAPIENRIGQQLKNLLRDRLNPLGEPRNPSYKLVITLQNPVYRQGVRTDDTATRATISYLANYQLLHKKDTVVTGSSKAVTGYNILKTAHGTLASEKDTKARAAKILANDISLRLAVFFRDKNH